MNGLVSLQYHIAGKYFRQLQLCRRKGGNQKQEQQCVSHTIKYYDGKKQRTHPMMQPVIVLASTLPFHLFIFTIPLSILLPVPKAFAKERTGFPHGQHSAPDMWRRNTDHHLNNL